MNRAFTYALSTLKANPEDATIAGIFRSPPRPAARTSEGDISPGVAAAEAVQGRFGLVQTGPAQLFVHLCRVPLWLTARVRHPQHAAFPDPGR